MYVGLSRIVLAMNPSTETVKVGEPGIFPAVCMKNRHWAGFNIGKPYLEVKWRQVCIFSMCFLKPKTFLYCKSLVLVVVVVVVVVIVWHATTSNVSHWRSCSVENCHIDEIFRFACFSTVFRASISSVPPPNWPKTVALSSFSVIRRPSTRLEMLYSCSVKAGVLVGQSLTHPVWILFWSEKTHSIATGIVHVPHDSWIIGNHKMTKRLVTNHKRAEKMVYKQRTTFHHNTTDNSNNQF